MDNTNSNELNEEEYISEFITQVDNSEKKITSTDKLSDELNNKKESKSNSIHINFKGLTFPTDKKLLSTTPNASLSVFFVASLFYMELILRISLDINKSLSQLFNMGLIYTFLFSIFWGVVASLICEIPPTIKAKKIFSFSITLITTALFLVEYFLKQTYGNYMGLSVILKSAGAVAGSYSSMIWKIIFKGIPIIILYLAPITILVLLRNKIFFEKDKLNLKKNAIRKLIWAFGCLLLVFIMLFSISGGTITDKQYLTSHFNINKSTSRFGLMCASILDANYALCGTPIDSTAKDYPIYTPKLDISEYANIVTDIDFSKATSKNSSYEVELLSDYFSSTSPTEKNVYTGMFEGKNLIFICAEAFTSYVINPVDTPTLYKLANNGFVFSNYYKPSWMVSTSDGEYSLLTGLIPEYGVQSMYVGRYNNWYYTMANALSSEGYNTYAYHNHYYAYYDRDLTHENLGYDVWIGMGNGMEEYVQEQWPESDLEMIEGTTQLYVNSNEPFHVYYLTVSGHTEYNFDGNSMAYKNMNEISDTTSSTQVRAIKASNLELEKALTVLLEDLDKAGKLDDTVIVLSADHYPYGLSDEAYNELAGKELDTNFERYHNTLIIYNSAMEENVYVDKPCCDIDVLPTLLNLFGIEYDSRLLMGSDILSDASSMVIFQNYSWITEKGRYNGDTGEFTAIDGAAVPDGYVQTVSNIVANKVKYSEYILETDYYNLIFGD